MLPFLIISLLFPKFTIPCLYPNSVLILSQSTVFPSNCTLLEGRLRVDQTSNLSDLQLTELFANVQEIVGVVQIWNSELITASFLANIRRISGDLLDNTLSIVNNSQLISINISCLESADGKVEILNNNPLLNISSNCAVLHKAYFQRRSISLPDCGCQLDSAPFGYPSNCSIFYGNLIFDNVMPSIEVLYRLLSVKKLYGSLKVTNSNLETLGFLANLEEMEPFEDYLFDIHDNEYLRRLDLVNLRVIGATRKIQWARIVGDDLCVDPQFAQLLMHSDVVEPMLSVEYCPLNFINNPSLYCTGLLSNVPSTCTRYIGNIQYSNMDQRFQFFEDYDVVDKTKVPPEEIQKFQQFEYIFGHFYIQASGLTNLSLPNLKEIYSNHKNAAITLSYNTYLSEIDFPKLSMVYEMIQFIRNTNLTIDQEFCDRFTKNVKRITVAKGEEVWNEETFC